MAGYLEHLREDRGLSPGTVSRRQAQIRDYLAFLEGRRNSLLEMRLEDVDAYLAGLAGAGKSRSVLQSRAIAVRDFLRFLAAEGAHSQDLSRWVEAPRGYRDATVPPHFTWPEIEQLLTSVEEGQDPLSLRDRAMLALLCSYGLRSQEVAALGLDDIDWPGDRLLIVCRKGTRPLVLPLLEVVRIAVQQYLEKGRPRATPHRQVILSGSGCPMRATDIHRRLKVLTRRAGLGDGRGPHAIRRAVGTRLVEQGWGLGEVAQVLGHGSIDSTRVYLRLSLRFLRDVADNYAELI